MIYVLYAIHVVVCLFLILVVLLQQGKGADLSVFGGGTTQAAFGARGAATLLHKMTVGGFVAFILTTTGIGFLQGGGGQGSVMSTVGEEAPLVEQVPASEEGAPVEPASIPDETEPAEAVETEPVATDESAEPTPDGAGTPDS